MISCVQPCMHVCNPPCNAAPVSQSQVTASQSVCQSVGQTEKSEVCSQSADV